MFLDPGNFIRVPYNHSCVDLPYKTFRVSSRSNSYGETLYLKVSSTFVVGDGDNLKGGGTLCSIKFSHTKTFQSI